MAPRVNCTRATLLAFAALLAATSASAGLIGLGAKVAIGNRLCNKEKAGFKFSVGVDSPLADLRCIGTLSLDSCVKICKLDKKCEGFTVIKVNGKTKTCFKTKISIKGKFTPSSKTACEGTYIKIKAKA